MILFIISALMIFVSSYLLSGVLNKEKNILGLIYFILLSFSNVVFTFEILSLFSWISQAGVLVLNLIFAIISIFVWNKFERPLWSVDCRPVLKKVYLACIKDKYLLVLGLAWIFAMWVSAFLIVLLPVVNADADAYHVLRSVFWIGNHNLNHFVIGDFRNLSFPINSEILYAWNILFTHKLAFLGLFPLVGYLLSMISITKIMDYLHFSIRPKLWVFFIVTSFPAVIVQISGTETDIIIAGLVSSSIVLFWNSIKNSATKYIPLFMSALAYALAIGTKSPAIIAIPAVGFFMIVLSVYYKKKEFYKPLLYFLGFGIFNFILFAMYNYALNLINFGNIAGSKNLIATHTFTFGIKAIPANIIKHLFLFFDFTGFKWGSYLADNLILLRDGITEFLNFAPCPDGINSDTNIINQSLLEPVMGLGILGMIAFVPCWILTFVIPIFKRNRKTLGLLCLGIMLLIFIVSMAVQLQFMVYSVRFLMFFAVVVSPILIYSYSRKNNPYKFVVTLFALYYLLLVSTHLWSRPYYKIVKYFKSGYTISQVREISACSQFLKTPLPTSKFNIHKKYVNKNCELRNFIEDNFDIEDKILYFPNALDELLLIKMLDFKGYNIDYKSMENLDNIDLKNYDVIFSVNNKQSANAIQNFDPKKSQLFISAPDDTYNDIDGDYGCRYLYFPNELTNFVKPNNYPISALCKIRNDYYIKNGFKFYKNLEFENESETKNFIFYKKIK